MLLPLASPRSCAPGGSTGTPDRRRPASCGVDDSIVTCARTRGSRMKFLPVAAPTASAIWTMSASLKFGVIRWFGGAAAPRRRCAEASGREQGGPASQARATQGEESGHCHSGMVPGRRRRRACSVRRLPGGYAHSPASVPAEEVAGRIREAARRCRCHRRRALPLPAQPVDICRVRSCCLPFLITVTCASLEEPRVLKTSWPRDGSSSGVPLIAVTRSPGPQAETNERLAVATGVNADSPAACPEQIRAVDA